MAAPHRIMAEMQILSSSPFHSISEVTVHISPRREDREAYYVGGYGDDKLYGIAKKGLERLMMAAGIVEVSSESRRVDLRRWVGKWVGKYTQPDGKEIHLSGEKEMDLSVGGTRWTQHRQTELDGLLRAHGVKSGYFKRIKNSYKRGQEWLKPHHLNEYAVTVSPEDMDGMVFQAEAKATRNVNQASQFGMELAQSGARHRAIRAIMQIGQYTEAQLREPFIVIRSRFDWKAMQEQLGDETVKRLKAAQAAQAMGLPEAVIQGLIAAPSGSPMVDDLAEVSDKLTDPQSMTGPEAFEDLFGEEPAVASAENRLRDQAMLVETRRGRLGLFKTGVIAASQAATGDANSDDSEAIKFACDKCQEPLADYDPNGKTFTVSQLVDVGQGLSEPMILCGPCLKERRETREGVRA